MKKHQVLREISKVATGIILADLVSVFWFSSSGILPRVLLGINWTPAMIPVIVIFDIGLLILLTHYGWHTRFPSSRSAERFLLVIAGIIFAILALGHLTILTFNLDLIFGTYVIPRALSWIGLIVATYLSYVSFHFAVRKK